MKIAVIVAWYNLEQLEDFKDAWDIKGIKDKSISLYFSHDANKEGCAKTKNKAIKKAYQDGCDYFIILDDDCYPVYNNQIDNPMEKFVQEYIETINEKFDVILYKKITEPQSRGTPYTQTYTTKKIGCCTGFWLDNPDYDAKTIVEGKAIDNPTFYRRGYYKQYISLCGMNLCFKREFAPLFMFINIDRFDDIWMGWLVQKYLYDNGFAISTKGPLIKHTRQSNLLSSLEKESRYISFNEQLWNYIEEIKPYYTGDVKKDYEYLIKELTNILKQKQVNPILIKAFEEGDKIE